MPPRQPLRPAKTTRKGPRGATTLEASAPSRGSMLAAALREEAPEHPKSRRASTFSPYPDLSMAITMLAKRQQALLQDGERAELVTRWLEQLQALQAAMQKLHRLEQLAGRLSKVKN